MTVQLTEELLGKLMLQEARKAGHKPGLPLVTMKRGPESKATQAVRAVIEAEPDLPHWKVAKRVQMSRSRVTQIILNIHKADAEKKAG